MKKSYHLNPDGKIYPCRARVQKCPYGDDMHAETKEELYVKAMQIYKTVKPSKGVMSELKLYGAFSDFTPMSKELETSNAPIELILASLDEGIKTVKENPYKHSKNPPSFVVETEENAIELCRSILRYNEDIPKWIPDRIIKESFKRWREYDNSKVDLNPMGKAYIEDNPIIIGTKKS